MKKLILFLPLFFIGCEVPEPPVTNTGFIYANGSRELKKYNLNGHEYIGSLMGSNSDVLTHSGECTNPIHFKRDTTSNK